MQPLLVAGALLAAAALTLLITGLRTGDPAVQRRRLRAALVVLLASLALNAAAVLA